MKKIKIFLMNLGYWLATGEKIEQAYACQYLLSTVHFKAQEDKVIIDLSAYEDYKIASCTVYVTGEPITQEEVEINHKTVVVRRALLFRTRKKKEIFWNWELA